MSSCYNESGPMLHCTRARTTYRPVGHLHGRADGQLERVCCSALVYRDGILPSPRPTCECASAYTCTGGWWLRVARTQPVTGRVQKYTSGVDRTSNSCEETGRFHSGTGVIHHSKCVWDHSGHSLASCSSVYFMAVRYLPLPQVDVMPPHSRPCPARNTTRAV